MSALGLISSDLLFKSFCFSGKVLIAIFSSKQRIHRFELLLIRAYGKKRLKGRAEMAPDYNDHTQRSSSSARKGDK